MTSGLDPTSAEGEGRKTRPPALLDHLATVGLRAGRGFFSHRCLIGASALSYSTLLSFLPLTAIVLVVFANFPIFADARSRFVGILLSNFAPDVGDNATRWFQYVATNAAQTTAIGVIAFVFTSIMLLATIEDQLDGIWDMTTRRTWGQRIMAYWLILTLGPVLLGGALSLSTYADYFAAAAGPRGLLATRTMEEWGARAMSFIPFGLEFVSLSFFYCVIPNSRVRWRDGITGALFAAILMEALRWVFALYVSKISSYSLVYGALAGIPIFLLWMYIFWVVVLMGAEIAAAMAPRWIAPGRQRARQPAVRPELAFGLLVTLAEKRSRGGTVSTDELCSRCGTSPAVAQEHLSLMQGAGLVAAAGDGGWVLARNLVSLNLLDLCRALNLSLPAEHSD